MLRKKNNPPGLAAWSTLTLGLTFELTLGSGMAWAQTPPSAVEATASAALLSASTPASAAAANPAELPALTNTATRTDRRIDEVPATVTVTPAREIETQGARDLKDLFRNQVDISVRAAPARFGAAGASTGRAGNEGLNIRGLEGNQVLILVDGVRAPASFSFGAFATGRLDSLSLETTAAAEVLRGPASTSFGSDGLAGALVLRTLDPADVLQPGRNSGGFVRLGGTQVDDSVMLTAAAAFRSNRIEGLLLLSQRNGHETDSQGTDNVADSRRTAPNPVDYRQQALLGKLGFNWSPQHRIGATLEATRRDIDTDVLSGRAVIAVAPAPPAVLSPTAVVGLTADDRVERTRIALDHRYDDLDAVWLQKASTRLYLQHSTTRQLAAEDRNTAADRTRDSRYRERVVGLSTQLETSRVGTTSQRLSYGLDASRTRIDAVRDGTPNPSAPPPFGETFPAKPFPDTDYTLLGAFVQDEIELPTAAGRVTLIPGLRYDRYNLDPSGNGYGGDVPVKLSGDAVTPRFGLLWRVNEALVPYAQWSRGFRAPTPGQVNNSFSNVAVGYRSEGNPNLQAEKASSIEIGLRGQFGSAHNQLRWQVAAYDNRYRDFISQEVVGGSFTPADPAVFQHINLASARIRGVELRGDWRFARDWSLSLASATARGTSTRAGVDEPLDSIDPLRTALGLRFERGAWLLHADVLHANAKSRSRIAAADPPASSPSFAPGAYTVLDLGARWQPRPDWTLVANLNNVTNATYWRWSDVRGLADNSPVRDAYTAPGRHLQLSLRHDF